MSRLHIIPLSLKNTEHELFTLQTPNLSSEVMTEFELEDLLLDIKIPLSATKDIFVIHKQEDTFWSEEKKRFIRIIYSTSDLQGSRAEIVELLNKNFCLDIFIDHDVHPSALDFLNNVGIHPANLRFIVIENSLTSQSRRSIYDIIPSQFKSRIFFLYLPPRTHSKILLKAEEVLLRIEDRRQECLKNRETLKVLSITNLQIFKDEPIKKIFYLNPNQENYYKYLQQLRLTSETNNPDYTSSIYFYFLRFKLVIQKMISFLLTLSLAFVWKLRHIYWSLEFLLTLGVPKIFSIIAKAYWSIFSYIGFIRVKLIMFFWVLYSLCAKSVIFIQNLPGKLYKFSVEFYWLNRKYLSFIQNKLIDMQNKLIQSYWQTKNSKYLRPFFKIYWFISFQFKKRIVSLFKNKKSNL